MTRLTLCASAILLMTGCHVDDKQPSEGDDAHASLRSDAAHSQEFTNGSSITSISFLHGSLTINGRSVTVPPSLDDLSALLGEPDRTLKKANYIYVWDRLGITAYRGLKEKKLGSLGVEYRSQGYEFSPHENFTGKVILARGELDANASENDLEAVGLKQDDTVTLVHIAEEGPYTVLAEFDRTLLGISLDWSPWLGIRRAEIGIH